MATKHARRNRLLLALFFGTLSVLLGSTAANASTGQTSSDPLNGQGMLLASDCVNIFTTYVVPVVVAILIVVMAFRLIARMSYRVIAGNGYTGAKQAYTYRDVHDPWND